MDSRAVGGRLVVSRFTTSGKYSCLWADDYAFEMCLVIDEVYGKQYGFTC